MVFREVILGWETLAAQGGKSSLPSMQELGQTVQERFGAAKAREFQQAFDLSLTAVTVDDLERVVGKLQEAFDWVAYAVPFFAACLVLTRL